MSPIGDRIRHLRVDLHISQGELARRAGIAQNTLSLIELGRTTPSVPTLERLAPALGVPLSELVEKLAAVGKAETPGARLLEGWLEKALTEDDFAHAFKRAKTSKDLADELHRARMKAADEEREVVKRLKKERAPQGDVLKAHRDL